MGNAWKGAKEEEKKKRNPCVELLTPVASEKLLPVPRVESFFFVVEPFVLVASQLAPFKGLKKANCASFLSIGTGGGRCRSRSGAPGSASRLREGFFGRREGGENLIEGGRTGEQMRRAHGHRMRRCVLERPLVGRRCLSAAGGGACTRMSFITHVLNKWWGFHLSFAPQYLSLPTAYPW